MTTLSLHTAWDVPALSKQLDNQKRARFTFVKALSRITKYPWAVAVTVIGIAGTIATILLNNYSKKSHKKIVSLLLGLLEKLDKCDERDVMDIHAKLEGVIESTKQLTNITKQFYSLRPLHIQYRNMTRDLEKLERSYFEYLYPDYNKELSADEQKELIEAFKPWQEDSQKVLTHG